VTTGFSRGETDGSLWFRSGLRPSEYRQWLSLRANATPGFGVQSPIPRAAGTSATSIVGFEYRE
jgi:hypothetical protein